MNKENHLAQGLKRHLDVAFKNDFNLFFIVTFN